MVSLDCSRPLFFSRSFFLQSFLNCGPYPISSRYKTCTDDQKNHALHFFPKNHLCVFIWSPVKTNIIKSSVSSREFVTISSDIFYLYSLCCVSYTVRGKVVVNIMYNWVSCFSKQLGWVPVEFSTCWTSSDGCLPLYSKQWCSSCC